MLRLAQCLLEWFTNGNQAYKLKKDPAPWNSVGPTALQLALRILYKYCYARYFELSRPWMRRAVFGSSFLWIPAKLELRSCFDACGM